MPTLIVMLGYEFVVFAVALVGICLFLAYFRRVPLTPARAPIPRGEQRYVWLSPGAAIVYATTAIALLLSYL